MQGPPEPRRPGAPRARLPVVGIGLRGASIALRGLAWVGFAAAVLGALVAAAGPRPIDGWEDVHFGLRPLEVMALLPGSRLDRTLCDARLARNGAVRPGEVCEHVEAQRFVGYLPFDLAVYFSRATGRAVRIHLLLRDTAQWNRTSYDAIVRSVERIYGPARAFLPLGVVFEDYCALQLRHARLGESVSASELVPPRCEAADEIEGRGGRIALALCVHERCPNAASFLPAAGAGIAGMRILEIELVAARAPGEPAS